MYYYPDLTIRTMNDVLGKPCTYSVLDFGVPAPGSYRDFLACDLRIVVCHASVWKSQSVERFVCQLTKYNIRQKAVKFLSYGGMKRDSEQIARRYDIPVFSIPDLKDPFHINSEFFAFFEQLMKGE